MRVEQKRTGDGACGGARPHVDAAVAAAACAVTMTPVGEVFLAIFLTVCAFAALVAFCKFFCKNEPVTCAYALATFASCCSSSTVCTDFTVVASAENHVSDTSYP